MNGSKIKEMSVEEIDSLIDEYKNKDLKEEFRKKTLEHKKLVLNKLSVVISNLMRRAIVHDDSKMEDPECFGFAKTLSETPDFGTKEYDVMVESMSSTVEHHYRENPHHPEHYDNGINDMNLVDIIEMLCDWKASAERDNNGNIKYDYLKERFDISDQLLSIIINTEKKFFF